MLLQIAYILCHVSYYCQGQSSNEILYTSNPIIEVVAGPTISTSTTTRTTTTTAAPVTYNELNLFTSNPILIDSNDLPSVVPLLSNKTTANTSIEILTTEFPSNALLPESTLLLTPFVTSNQTELPETVTQPELFITFLETQQPLTIPQTQQPSTVTETEQPPNIPDTQQSPTFPETQQPPTFFETQQPPIFPETQQPPTFPETQQPPTFFETQQPPIFPETQQPPTFLETQQPPAFPTTLASTVASIQRFGDPTISLRPEIEINTESSPSATLPAATIQQLVELAINNVLPSTRKCGLQMERGSRLDGSIANIDEFPWLVLFRYHDINCLNAGFRCSGTLISRQYVITAANCVVTRGEITGPKTAVLGEYRISSPFDCTYNFYREECADRVVEVPIAKHFLHPDYSYSYRNNNLALLRLESKVDFSRFIAPICLPTKNLESPAMGKILVTSGWGATENGVESDIKTKTDIPVLSDYQCSMKLYRQMSVFKHQVCIGTDFQKRICRADYGGPVMSADRNGKPQWYLEGIISGGFGFGRNGVPNIYTRISPYVEWILSTMAQDAYNAI